MTIKADALKSLRDFIEGQELQNLIHTFRNPVFEALVHHQADYDAKTDSLQMHHYGFDEFPYEYCTITNFATILDRKLNEMQAEILAFVNSVKKSTRINDVGRNKIFKHLLVQLQAIQLMPESEDISLYKEAIDSFFSILYDLITTEANKPVSLSFAYRQKDNYALSRLYDLSIKGISFIDKSETDWKMFEAILTSPNVYAENIEYKIQFQCSTRMAAYVLRSMEQYFRSLNFATVVSSQRFYSQRGILIKGSNLDVSLKRDSKPIKYRKSIDDFFASL